jgi:hypothetical protein
VPRATTALHIRQIDRDLAIETARAQQSGIEHIGPVRRRDDNDALLRVESVHLDEKRIERLFALIMAASDAMAAMPADRVDFVDENNAGRGFLPLLEHVAHAGRADADEHFHEVRPADREEGHIRFAGDGPGEQRLAGPGRSNQENAFWNSSAELLEFFRVAQEFDEFLHLILGFLDAGYVFEGDLILVSREHARLGFTEVQGALAGHADLLAEKKIEDEQEKGDGQEADERLRHQVRLHLDRRLNICLGEAFLEVGVVVQENRRAKEHGLGRDRTNALLDVIAAQSLGGPAFLDDQLQRVILIDRDLFVLEQLEEAIVGHVLDVCVSAAPEENCQAD